MPFYVRWHRNPNWLASGELTETDIFCRYNCSSSRFQDLMKQLWSANEKLFEKKLYLGKGIPPYCCQGLVLLSVSLSTAGK